MLSPVAIGVLSCSFNGGEREDMFSKGYVQTGTRNRVLKVGSDEEKDSPGVANHHHFAHKRKKNC